VRDVQGNGASSLIFLAILVGLFYFMLIRPQKRRVQQHAQLVNSISEGDEVVTIGGIYGTVAVLGDDDIVLEVADGTRVRFVKSAISRRVTEDLDEDDDDQDADALGAGTEDAEASAPDEE
jgi:preprotein translocase subunit YajC